jgi:hypothetical protein
MRLRPWLAGALLLNACAGPPADARSPALVKPASVVGAWTLTLDGEATCKLLLGASTARHGYEASSQGGCPVPIAVWRPVPDGIELAGADGLTLILLEPAGVGAYRGFDAARRPVRLVRQRAQAAPAQ